MTRLDIEGELLTRAEIVERCAPIRPATVIDRLNSGKRTWAELKARPSAKRLNHPWKRR